MSNVIKELNQIQADSYMMFLKLHNFHWNIKGINFFSIHEYTESSYDQMSEIFDEMAERALQLNGKALVLNADLVKKSNIKEEKSTTFNTKEVLSTLKEDYEYFLKAFKKLSKEANKADDVGTVAIADDNIAKLQKRLWMLNSTMGK